MLSEPVNTNVESLIGQLKGFASGSRHTTGLWRKAPPGGVIMHLAASVVQDDGA
jgi:hypothetical protein